MKEILLKQVELLQEACEREMFPEDAARLSEALASALAVATRNYIPELLKKKFTTVEAQGPF